MFPNKNVTLHRNLPFPVVTPPWNHPFITGRVSGLFNFCNQELLQLLPCTHLPSIPFWTQLSCVFTQVHSAVSNSSPSVCCWHHLAPSLQSSSSCFLCMWESLCTTPELLNTSNCPCNNLGVKDMSWMIPICKKRLKIVGDDPLRLGACVLVIWGRAYENHKANKAK